MSVRSFIAGFCVSLGLSAAAQSVTLTDNGTSVVMDNGLVTATFSKSSGNCTDLRLPSGPNLLANGGKLYFDANGSTGTNPSAYFNFTPDAYRVVTNTAALAEIAITDTNLTGFNAELHYAMRAGDPGFYVFVVWRHGAGSPVCMLEQSRTVLRCDPNLFTNAFISPHKTGQMISPALLAANLPTISDATYKLPLNSSYTNATGYTDDLHPVYSKYDWAEYTENLRVEGLSSETIGLWMMFGGREYFNGGPTRANLILHGTETTPLLLWDFHAQHFGGSKIFMATNQVWSKLVGPAFVYVNSGTNSAQLWHDAQVRAAAEEAAWPCAWMNETNYPVARGTLTGQLHVLGASCSNALVVLAQPGTNWHMQSDGYQFWTRAVGDGSFLLPKVRAGTYCLFAHVPGLTTEYQQLNVTMVAGQTNQLGTIEWHPPRRERRLWRIGTPDLSAGEFRFGDQMRQWGLWWRYLEERGTNDIVYRVGSSTTTNWYYAQMVTPLDNGTWFSPRWQVEFVLTNLPPSPALLTMDLAGANGGNLQTTVNGTSLANISAWNESSIMRSATRSGAPRHHELSFSPSLLRLGTNIVTFQMDRSSSTWTGTKPVGINRAAMWDSVQLEAGGLLTNFTPHITDFTRVGTNLFCAGTGGMPDGIFHILTATNSSMAMTNWTVASTGSFDGEGKFTTTLPISPDAVQRFYRLQIP